LGKCNNSVVFGVSLDLLLVCLTLFLLVCICLRFCLVWIPLITEADMLL
jgi:hypothetical protein